MKSLFLLLSLLITHPSFANCALSAPSTEINLHGYIIDFGEALETVVVKKSFHEIQKDEAPDYLFSFTYGDVPGRWFPRAKLDFKITEVSTAKVIYLKTDDVACYSNQMCQLDDYRKVVLKALKNMGKNSLTCQ